jgi:hypothetical protein
VASTAAPQANVGNSERALAAAPTPTKAATNAMNSSPGKSALRRPDLLTRSRALSIAPDRDADKLIPYDDSRNGANSHRMRLKTYCSCGGEWPPYGVRRRP